MPTISLTSPADLLTVLPYHLGFRPERSVVAVCLHGRRLGLVARLDLVGAAEADRAVSATLPALLRDRPSSVTLVGYEDRPGDARALLDALDRALQEEEVPVGERLVVRGGRWFGLDCGCCEAPGRPLPDDADVPAVADYVALGTHVLSGREALERLVEPLGPDDDRYAARLVAVGEAVSAWPREPSVRVLEAALRGWDDLLAGRFGPGPEPDLDDADVARLLAPLADPEVRDAVAAWLCPGALPLSALPRRLRGAARRTLRSGPVPGGPDDEDAWDEAVEARVRTVRLDALCRATPVEHAAPVLTVTAVYAWWCGDGARASVALDRALEVDPGYRLAVLVRSALDHGIRPRRRA